MIISPEYRITSGAPCSPDKPQNPGCDTEVSGLRYYNPSVGRWINRDPIEERGGKNVYAMVGNNPIDFCDFRGLSCCKEGQVLIVGIGVQSLATGSSSKLLGLGDALGGLADVGESAIGVSDLAGSAGEAGKAVSEILKNGVNGMTGAAEYVGSQVGESVGTSKQKSGGDIIRDTAAALLSKTHGAAPLKNYYTLIKFKRCADKIFKWSWSEDVETDPYQITTGGDIDPGNVFYRAPSQTLILSYQNTQLNNFRTKYGASNIVYNSN